MQLDYATKVHALNAAEMGAADREDTDAKDVADGSADISDSLPTRLKEHVSYVVMFGTETGFGESLSYILPYVQEMCDESLTLKLKAKMLVPSREL